MKTKSPDIRFPGFKDSWTEQRLGKLFTSSRAKGRDGMPTLSVTLNRGLINRDDMDRKTETNLDADEHLLVREGDIAYNMMRMWQGAFGRSSCEGMVSPAYVVIRPMASADSGYFEYAFRRARSIYLFWAYSYGLTNDRLRLYAPDFLRIPFSAPTLPEQRKIADFLTAVDGRIQQLSQKLALLQDYKKGVMQQLFTQALRFKDDHGNEFPDWEEKTLGEVCEKVGSGKTPKGGEQVYQTSGVKFIRSQNVSSNRLDLSSVTFISEEINAEMKGTEVRPLDVLLNITGASIGRTCVVPEDFDRGNVNQHVCIIRADKDALSPLFLQLFLSSAFGQKLIDQAQSGSGREGLNFQSIRKFAIPFPSLPEQTKIANFLTALDRKIESVARQINHNQSFKKGLLQQMFV